MAAGTSYTAATGDRSVNQKTLVANNYDTITIPGVWPYVEVVSDDGAAIISFTTDGTVPASAGGTTYEVPAAIGSRKVRVRGFPNPTVVRVISTGTPVYSVLVDIQ